VKPPSSWFATFTDAVFQAHFRAAITGLRYRVTYDRANKLWNLIETVERIR
jgi:hypothetical protein